MRFKTITTKTDEKSLGVSGIYKKIHEKGADVNVFVKKGKSIHIKAYDATEADVIYVDSWVKAKTVDELPENLEYTGSVILFKGYNTHLTVVDTIDNFRKVLEKLSGKGM